MRTRTIVFCLSPLALALTLAGTTALSGPADSYRNLDKRECPILDTPYRTLSGLSVGYAFDAPVDAPGWGDLSYYEVDGWVRFMDWENDLGADIEMRAQWNSIIIETSSDTDGYPLTRAGIFMQWSQRFEDGWGMQVHATPGIYSGLETLEGDDFSVPAGLRIVKAFSPDSAIFAGGTVYPTFDQTFDPALGFLWAKRDDVIVQLAYPESRLEVSPSSWFRLKAGARLWTWPDYNMGDDERERLQFSEARVFGGFDWAVGELTVLSIEGGYLLEREISFDTGSEKLQIDDAPFVMIGLGGRL